MKRVGMKGPVTRKKLFPMRGYALIDACTKDLLQDAIRN